MITANPAGCRLNKTTDDREVPMTDPVVAQDSPYQVSLKEGERYAWCTCGLSTKQPFCDGAHKQTEDLKPMVFVAEKHETVFLCGCKQTSNGPHCDGTHSTL